MGGYRSGTGKGVARKQEGAVWEPGGTPLERGERQKRGAAKEERFWLLREPNLTVLYLATAAPNIYLAALPSGCLLLVFAAGTGLPTVSNRHSLGVTGGI